MKRTVSIMLCVLLLVSTLIVPLTVNAVSNDTQSVGAEISSEPKVTSDGEWGYELVYSGSGSNVRFHWIRLTDYLGKKTTVTVPTEIEGYYVGQIKNVLKNNSTIKKLIIPDSSKYTLNADENPSGYTVNYPLCFANCTSLEEVEIGSFFGDIPKECFKNDTNLKTVTFTEAYQKQKTVKFNHYAFENTGIEDFTCPRNLNGLGGRIFKDCKKLKNITINNSATYCAGTFSGCSSLTQLIIPENISNPEIFDDPSYLPPTNLKNLIIKSKSSSCTMKFSCYSVHKLNSMCVIGGYSGTKLEEDIKQQINSCETCAKKIRFHSLGQCEGEPYVPTTTEPTTVFNPTVNITGNEDVKLWLRDYENNKRLNMNYNSENNTYEITATGVPKGERRFSVEVYNTDFTIFSYDQYGYCDGSGYLYVPEDNSTVKFVFDGTRVYVYINNSDTPLETTTAAPTTTTTVTVPPTTTQPITEKVVDSILINGEDKFVYPFELNTNDSYTGTYSYTIENFAGQIWFESEDNTIAQVRSSEYLNKNNGTFTIVGLNEGTTNIKVYFKNTLTNTPYSKTIKVTVKNPNTEPPVVEVTSVKLNADAKTLSTGNKTTLKATVNPDNATNKNVKWTTSNNKVATVTSTGVVTAKARGTAYIRATAKDGSRKYAQCKVTVKQPVTKIIVKTSNNKTIKNGSTITLKVNKSLNVKAYAYPKNANVRTVSWKLSNRNNYVKLSKTTSNSGKLVRITAKKTGGVVIGAYSRDGSKKNVRFTIRVVK